MAAVGISCLTANARADEQTGKSFVERFDRLSRSFWYVADGWANGDWQACTFSDNNVAIADGALSVELKAQKLKDRDYSCASVQSTQVFGYGTYEARMQSAAASGTVSAFFAYAGGPPLNQPGDEIDFEVLGRDTNKVQLNYFVDAKPQGPQLVDVGSDSSKGMNDYAFEWAPNALRWYINGKLVREVIKSDNMPFPTHKMRIFLMIWNSMTLTDWLGPFKAQSETLAARFAWVAFTKAGESCQFPESLLCKLKR
ncbi:MAG: family 16 glycosylhydrolase [Hyphomicrobium sp.]|uniref:family 16 glycosylhydrolase n=1 Tax=Hyphomicrobium sp. TaxID=82 RepID=UPI0039E4D682